MAVSIPFLVFAILALAVLGFGVRRAAGAYLRFHGPGVVACPEDGEPAAVRLSGWRVFWTATFGRPKLRLRDCSHWRDHGPCGQPCLARIEAAPEECLIRQKLARWYKGKSCACCGKPFEETGWVQHKPCLMSPELQIIEWKDIEPEKIPRILETHRPLCWTCQVAETRTW